MRQQGNRCADPCYNWQMGCGACRIPAHDSLRTSFMCRRTSALPRGAIGMKKAPLGAMPYSDFEKYASISTLCRASMRS